jgi:uncharacterized protein DUF6636
MRVALAVLILLAFPAGASAAFVQFRSPTGKIGCAFESGGSLKPIVRCEWAGSNDRAVWVGRHGRAHHLRISDTVRDPHAKVLKYGHSKRFHQLRCTSRRSGMTCRSTLTGHGFTVSVQRQRLF